MFYTPIILLFNYINNILGPYKFSLQATVDHDGYFILCGHYTAFQ